MPKEPSARWARVRITLPMNGFRVGVVGCGNISSIYLKNLTAFPQTEVAAVCDLNEEKATSIAAEYKIAQVLPMDQLLADPSIDAVVNLTIPDVHFEVAMKVVASGKHVYSEKPLTLTRAESVTLLKAAADKGVLVGCAPDTVLGAGIQTARQVIDSGSIGTPLHAQAWMMGAGVEKWHPNPEFYYRPGGGPLFDMGPYYLTALVTLLGPVKTVAAQHAIGVKDRLIESEPFSGQTIHVSTPTHISLVASFMSGAIAQFTASFDTFGGPDYPCIDVFGTEGVVRVPDPNNFGGSVMRRKAWDAWEEVAVTRPYDENSRGLGVLDMLFAAKNKRPARASGQLAAHLVDVMQGALESGSSGRFVQTSVLVDRPAAMPETLLSD